MFRKTAMLVLAVATVALVAGCTKPTKVTGTLLLQAGQTGDVQNCRVELYEKADLTGTPVQFVSSENSGSANNSPFTFTDVLEGYYYLLAWKDMDGDGVVDDGDIVGVRGGTYTPGHGGEQLTVTKGKTTDAGNIEMMIYKELIITASGVRSNGNTQTDFTYTFNYGVTITSLTITFPGFDPVLDPAAVGTWAAGTYHSDGWNNGGVMPTGTHTLEFVGTWGGGAFDVTVPVTVN